MAGHTRWGKHPHLSNLYWLKISELETLYVAYTRGTLKGKKSYWTNKIKRGEVPMPPKPEKEPTMEDKAGRLKSTWEVAAFDRESNDWTTQTLHSYDHTLDNQIYDQAAPAKITPSRRKVPTRDHKTLFVFSDAQIDYRRTDDNELQPIHDERAIKVAHLICRDLQPDEIINCGDTIDLASLSRFEKDSDHFHRTLGPSFQRVHDMYAQFRADNPQAKITEVDSNHNTRLKKHMLKNNDPFYNFKRPGEPEEEYPVNTYPYLANLRHLGINWVSGYGAAEYVYGTEYDTPPIIFKHGNTSRSSGSTAVSELNSETHVVRGHSHRIESMYRTNRAGDYMASIVVGVLCSIDGDVPGVHSAIDDRNQVVKKKQNWQQGILVIRDYDGEYEFTHVPIRDGIALYNGKIYNGESDD